MELIQTYVTIITSNFTICLGLGFIVTFTPAIVISHLGKVSLIQIQLTRCREGEYPPLKLGH